MATAVRGLERAGVTAVLLEGPSDGGAENASVGVSPFETTTLASYLGRMTSSIGIVPSDSALYGFPYHVARRLATLDHFTDGRAGWAVRTWSSPHEMEGFSWRSVDGRAVERNRAAEFMEIALELWDSWEAGAQHPDKASGDYKDDSGVHRIEYRSTSFLVRGPLDVPRSPQGRPIIFADVREDADVDLAASFADVVELRAADPTALAAGLAQSVERHGRIGQVRVLPVVSVEGGVGAVGLGADAVHAAGSARDLVRSLGADGVTVGGGDSDDWLSWVAEELVPALGITTPKRTRATLAERLELEDVMAHGRRAA